MVALIDYDAGNVKSVEKAVEHLGYTALLTRDRSDLLNADSVILPGVGVALDALTSRASQLSGIAIEAPKRIIGKNTIECMKSGVLYSNAGAIDGCIERLEEELGQKCTVVATGGLAKKIIPHCKREIILDEDLLLKGLLVIYEKNKA